MTDLHASIETMTDRRKQLRQDFEQRDQAMASALQAALETIDANAELEITRTERQAREALVADALQRLDRAEADLESALIKPLSAQISAERQVIGNAYQQLADSPARLDQLFRQLMGVAGAIGAIAQRHSGAFADDQARLAWIDAQLDARIPPLLVALSIGLDVAPSNVRQAIGFRGYLGDQIRLQFRQIAATGGG